MHTNVAIVAASAAELSCDRIGNCSRLDAGLHMRRMGTEERASEEPYYAPGDHVV